jgi:hypothetical protein
VAARQEEWYRGFPVSYETENPFFMSYLAAMAVTSVTDTEDPRLAENDHQQQEEEEKAVIDASNAITTHMVVPPYYDWLILYYYMRKQKIGYITVGKQNNIEE